VLVVYGPTLVVDLGFDPAPADGLEPDLAAKGVEALVDTGASDNFIDDDLAGTLRLPVVDRLSVSGSAGRHEINMYLAQVHVPALGITISGRFGGVHLAAGGQRHQVLVGRSFLADFKMTYDGISGAVALETP
jgi:predicted aspartyl protease